MASHHQVGAAPGPASRNATASVAARAAGDGARPHYVTAETARRPRCGEVVWPSRWGLSISTPPEPCSERGIGKRAQFRLGGLPDGRRASGGDRRRDTPAQLSVDAAEVGPRSSHCVARPSPTPQTRLLSCTTYYRWSLVTSCIRNKRLAKAEAVVNCGPRRQRGRPSPPPCRARQSTAGGLPEDAGQLQVPARRPRLPLLASCLRRPAAAPTGPRQLARLPAENGVQGPSPSAPGCRGPRRPPRLRKTRKTGTSARRPLAAQACAIRPVPQPSALNPPRLD